jgi:hypothetical protein
LRIHTAENEQLYVNAISKFANGSDVEGHLYFTTAGIHNGSIQFQRGPVPGNGVNGITNECLLHVLLHRTKFLNTKFPCVENALAIQHMEEALGQFNNRTAARIARGVEGKEVV